MRPEPVTTELYRQIDSLVKSFERNSTSAPDIEDLRSMLALMSKPSFAEDLEDDFQRFHKALETGGAYIGFPPSPRMAQLLVLLNWFDKVTTQGKDTGVSSIIEQLAGVFRGLPNLVKDRIAGQLQPSTTAKSIFTKENIAKAKSILGLENRNKRVSDLNLDSLQLGQAIGLDADGKFIFLKVVDRKLHNNEVIVRMHGKGLNDSLVQLNINENPLKIGSPLKGKLLVDDSPLELGSITSIILC